LPPLLLPPLPPPPLLLPLAMPLLPLLANPTRAIIALALLATCYVLALQTGYIINRARLTNLKAKLSQISSQVYAIIYIYIYCANRASL